MYQNAASSKKPSPPAENGAVESAFMLRLSKDPASLSRALITLSEAGLSSISHLETRPSKVNAAYFDVLVRHEALPQERHAELQAVAQKISAEYPVTHQNGNSEHLQNHLPGYPSVPWFPLSLSELILHQGKTLQSEGGELEADHPSFKDQKYRERRKMFAEISKTYVLGQPIPHVDYTVEENETWGRVYRKLTSLYPTHACKTFNDNFPLLLEHCGYTDKEIPQMELVSKFLQSRTGFRLRPISGLVDFRDFLGGLAFRVFHGTMYIRHPTHPEYTPEPDVCHELLGHVPLFCDPEFAQFSQEIGLASLGASEEWVEKLGNLYWYTVEFGLCKEPSGNRAYGGALLSSYGELQHALTKEANVMPLEVEHVAATPYPITRFQDAYFLAESFRDVRDKLAQWMTKIPRPFALRYNAFTENIEILRDKEDLAMLARDLQTDVRTLMDTISKL